MRNFVVAQCCHNERCRYLRDLYEIAINIENHIPSFAECIKLSLRHSWFEIERIIPAFFRNIESNCSAAHHLENIVRILENIRSFAKSSVRETHTYFSIPGSCEN